MTRTYSLFALLALFVATIVVPNKAAAQYGTIRGVVFDSDLRDELPGATVMLNDLQGEKKYVITGRDGLYAFHRIFPGQYSVTTSFIGFTSQVDTLEIAVGAELFLEIRLDPSEIEMDELVVETSRTQTDRFVAGLDTVLPEDLMRIPMPDVSYDLAGYLLTVPGVVSPGDRGGQLFIRGGTPTQNLVLLDGMIIFQPFHIVGFFSAFPADIVAFTDIYAGGYGARYGGRISSVIDIATRNGSKTKPKGAISIAPFLSTIRIEAPLVKNKVSLLVSIRQSLIEYVAPTLIGQEFPFRFGDMFVKFHAFLNQTSSFTATVLRTTDQGNIDSEKAFDEGSRLSTWENEAYGVRYDYIPSDFPAMVTFAVNYSRLVSQYKVTADDIRDSSVDLLAMQMNFDYLMGGNKVNIGVFGNLNRFHYEFGRTPEVASFVSSGGAFVDAQFLPSEYLRIEPGMRIEAFSHGVTKSFEPRLRAIIQPNGSSSKHQFSAAWGQYHQQIIGLSNEQDVSDVFTIWAASPQGKAVPAASHFLVGWKGRLKPWFELALEGYTKDMHNIAFPVFSDRVLGQPDFARISGEAIGADIKAEIQFPEYFFSTSYTISKVEYLGNADTAVFGEAVIDSERFYPPHDRRHQVNVMGQITRGRSKLSLRWQYGSGLPFTQVNGYYEWNVIEDPGDSSLTTGRGPQYVSRSGLYDARLPAYHRLDVSFEYSIRKNNVETTFLVGAINAYDNENIFEYNIYNGERVNQLPFTPSLALKVEVY